MYDKLWTAGKAMDTLNPALAEGGGLTIYAPHLAIVSSVHGRYMQAIGSRVLFFLRSGSALGIFCWACWRTAALCLEMDATKTGLNRCVAGGNLATQLLPEQCCPLA